MTDKVEDIELTEEDEKALDEALAAVNEAG